MRISDWSSDVCSSDLATAKAGFKFMRTTSLANSQSAKFTPQVRDQSREWEYVQDQLRQGQKLVRVFYGVMSVSPYGEGDRNERNLKAVYKAAGWELQDERYLQMAGLQIGRASGRERVCQYV